MTAGDESNRLIQLIPAVQNEAPDSTKSCEPDQLVLGVSAETFRDGPRSTGIDDKTVGFGDPLAHHCPIILSGPRALLFFS